MCVVSKVGSPCAGSSGMPADASSCEVPGVQVVAARVEPLPLYECVDDCGAAADGPCTPLEPTKNIECEDELSQDCERRAPSQSVSQMPAPHELGDVPEGGIWGRSVPISESEEDEDSAPSQPTSQASASDALCAAAVALDERVAEVDGVQSEPPSEFDDDGDSRSPSSPCAPSEPARQASVPDGKRGAAGVLACVPVLAEFKFDYAINGLCEENDAD